MVLRAFPYDESQSTRICAWEMQLAIVRQKENRSWPSWVSELLRAWLRGVEGGRLGGETEIAVIRSAVALAEHHRREVRGGVR
jgi:hypothetical protein